MSVNLRPSTKEITYQIRQFYESLRVEGIKCRIASILKTYDTHDFYGDLHERDTHEEYFDTYVTFDTAPTVQTLRSLGWYQSDQEDLPVIAHIPLLYESSLTGEITRFAPSIDDKLWFWTDGYVKDEHVYLIKELKGVGYPVVTYYVAKLVPYRSQKGADDP